MILVDKNIKELVKNDMLIVTNYKEENVNCVSYDLTVDSVVIENKEEKEYILKPKEFIMIKTQEEVKIPNNMLGRIAEKNSLLRTGLYVSGPHYQPGHQTYCFLRVYNMSEKNIKIEKNLKIAQIMFEFLQEVPETIYSENKNSSFNNENKYLGYGKYEEKYKNLIG